MIEVVLGLVVIGFLVALTYGLLTRRIAWRQQACCPPADPADDLRMRDTTPTDTTSSTAQRRAAP